MPERVIELGVGEHHPSTGTWRGTVRPAPGQRAELLAHIG